MLLVRLNFKEDLTLSPDFLRTIIGEGVLLSSSSELSLFSDSNVDPLTGAVDGGDKLCALSTPKDPMYAGDPTCGEGDAGGVECEGSAAEIGFLCCTLAYSSADIAGTDCCVSFDPSKLKLEFKFAPTGARSAPTFTSEPRVGEDEEDEEDEQSV